MTYEALQAHLAAWAGTQPAIRAIIVVGSQARGDADQWSDLDLVLLTADRARYLKPDWLSTLGNVWLTYLDKTGPGDPEWYAIYEDGLKVDVVILPVSDPALNLELLLSRYPYQAVFARGVRVLFDQQGQPRSLPTQAVSLPVPPSAADFDHLVSGFLVEAVTMAKFALRGDFWRSQHWLADELRPRLLTLMAWHAYGRDVWYNGRFMDSWADPRCLAALPQLFAHYDRASLVNALHTLLDLFLLIGEETAVRFRFTYPTETHHKIARYIDNLSIQPG